MSDLGPRDVVAGVGIDVAATERFERLLGRDPTRVWAHWYTAAETEECQRHPRPALAAATRFAVKEATYKAVGARFSRAVRWGDIEVLGSERRWRLSLHGEVAAAARVAGAQKFHVSTCETAGRVVAMVMAHGPAQSRAREGVPIIGCETPHEGER